MVPQEAPAGRKRAVPAKPEAHQARLGRGEEDRNLGPAPALAELGRNFDIVALPLVARTSQADGARAALAEGHDKIGRTQRIGKGRTRGGLGRRKRLPHKLPRAGVGRRKRLPHRLLGVEGRTAGSRGPHAQKKRAPAGARGPGRLNRIDEIVRLRHRGAIRSGRRSRA